MIEVKEKSVGAGRNNGKAVKIKEEAGSVTAQQLSVLDVATPGREKNGKVQRQGKTSTQVPF